VTVAYLALGSNLGDRLASLRAAVGALEAADGIEVVARSPVFETEAVADQPQPPYLNAAVRIETSLGPRALLALCLEVERSLGRTRPAGQMHAPRTIDIDVLLHGATTLNEPEPGLRLPHPELLARPFVRVPLAYVAEPGLRHPVSGEPLDQALPDPGVRRTDERL
jgi:2-amino-4-hydroxy-6-hydroxymethyldihydropteridine diphosphokinase